MKEALITFISLKEENGEDEDEHCQQEEELANHPAAGHFGDNLLTAHARNA